jgi:hypothetical protein
MNWIRIFQIFYFFVVVKLCIFFCIFGRWLFLLIIKLKLILIHSNLVFILDWTFIFIIKKAHKFYKFEINFILNKMSLFVRVFIRLINFFFRREYISNILLYFFYMCTLKSIKKEEIWNETKTNSLFIYLYQIYIRN